MTTRIERDSIGELAVPQLAYFGIQTQRAVNNFPISGCRFPNEFIHALGYVKWAAAKANRQLGMFAKNNSLSLSDKEIDALIAAALDVARGKFDDEFPVDVFQTGSGTSTNMNANEVIANRAMELLGGERFFGAQVAKPATTGANEAGGAAANAGFGIHSNDHVNLGQSTNDVFPTAMHVALAGQIQQQLLPALKGALETLKKKAHETKNVQKIGRTHLADATPLTLGQEISGWAKQVQRAVFNAQSAILPLLELPIGGTAIGTGINAHSNFGALVAEILAEQTGTPFIEATNHFEANAQRDGIVACHSLLKNIAVTFFNVANNIRILASGPRCGFYEIRLPELQPGSSIMPGKVNPVLCESVMQLTTKVIGNDTTISMAGASGGQFQLNIMMPLMADVVLESVRLLANGIKVFNEKCLIGIEANEKQCTESIEKSLSLATGLNPYIGYERAAALAKEAFETGETIREICQRKAVLPPDELNDALAY